VDATLVPGHGVALCVNIAIRGQFAPVLDKTHDISTSSRSRVISIIWDGILALENAGRLPAASDHAIQRQKIQHEMTRVMVVFDARAVGLESDLAVAVHGPQGIAVRTEREVCTNYAFILENNSAAQGTPVCS